MDDLDFLDEFDDEEDIEFNDLPLDDEFIRDHFSNIPNEVLENFPFVEDDVDAITDYELFSKGFGYLDDKKADKEELDEYVKKDEIPPLDDFVTKDTKDLTYYTKTSDLSNVALTGNYDDLIDKPELFSGDYNDLTNKPTIPTKTSELDNNSGFITKNVNDLTNYTLTTSLATVATTGNYNDLTNKPTIPDVSNFITKDVNDLTYYTLTTSLSSVATTGDYGDLLNKPTIPDVSNFITKDVNNLTYYTLSSNLSTVATSGSYNDLSNKPTIPTQLSDFGTVLYNDDNGSLTTIALSETSANYTYIDVFFNAESIYNSIRIYNPNGKQFALNVDNVFDNVVYSKKSMWTCSGSQISYNYGHEYYIDPNGVQGFTGSSNKVKINRVVGYK